MFKSARGPFKLQTKNKRQDGHPQISPNLTKSQAIRGSWTRFGFTVRVNGLLAGAASHCKSLPKSSENSDQSSHTLAEIRRYYQLKRKLDGKLPMKRLEDRSLTSHTRTQFPPHKILIVHLPELTFLCYRY